MRNDGSKRMPNGVTNQLENRVSINYTGDTDRQDVGNGGEDCDNMRLIMAFLIQAFGGKGKSSKTTNNVICPFR